MPEMRPELSKQLEVNLERSKDLRETLSLSERRESSMSIGFMRDFLRRSSSAWVGESSSALTRGIWRRFEWCDHFGGLARSY